MTSAEFTESLAFEALEPDPAEVTMRLTAQLLALMANVHRDPNQRQDPYESSDFLPQPPDKNVLENKRRYDDAIAQMRANYTARGLGRRH